MQEETMPLSRRIAVLAGAVLLISASTTRVVADGVVIPPTATAKVTIPDQEAIIHYKDGVETLAIETRFVGQGQQFAWIVPLPSVPKVSPVSKGTFPTLRLLFQPRVIHTIPRFYIGVILVSILIALIILRRFELVILYATLLFLGHCLLSSLGTAGLEAPSVPGAVKVHDRQVVGDYEVFTISSDAPDALTAWLTEHGFATAERHQTVIADYVAQGWKFVAVKLLRPSDTNAPTTPHPLAFTFKTDRPVYPLKLTATSGSPCSIALYVFGPARATVPGFEVTRCSEVNPDSSHWPARDGRIPLGHPGLRTLVEGSAFATKLSATLSPDQMRQDAFVSWQPFVKTEPVVYSARGAFEIIGNIAFAIFCVLLLSVVAGVAAKRISKSVAIKTLAVAASGILVVSAGAYAIWPKQKVKVSRGPEMWNESAHHQVAWRLEATSFDEPVTFDAVLSRISQYMHSSMTVGSDRTEIFLENPFTGQPRILEDSPGNYGLRWNRKNVLEYVWYTGHGSEGVFPLKKLSAIAATQPASSPSDDRKQESTQ